MDLFVSLGKSFLDESIKIAAVNLAHTVSERNTSSNFISDIDNLPDPPFHQVEKLLDNLPKNPLSYKIINLYGNPGTGKTNLMAQYCRKVASDKNICTYWIPNGKIKNYFEKFSSNPFNDEWMVISAAKDQLKKLCKDNNTRFMIFVDFPDQDPVDCRCPVDQEMVIRYAKALPVGSQMIVTSREPILHGLCHTVPIEGFTPDDASDYLKSHGVRDIFIEDILNKVGCVPSLLHQYVSQKKRNDQRYDEQVDDLLKKGDRIRHIGESMKHNRAAWVILRICCKTNDKELNEEKITDLAKKMRKVNNEMYGYSDEDIEAGIEYLKSCKYIEVNSDQKIVLHNLMIRTEYERVDWNDSFSDDFVEAAKMDKAGLVHVDYLSHKRSEDLKTCSKFFDKGRYSEYITEAKTILKSVKKQRFDERVDVEYNIYVAYSKLGEFENALDYALMGPVTHVRALEDIVVAPRQIYNKCVLSAMNSLPVNSWDEFVDEVKISTKKELKKVNDEILELGYLYTRLNNISTSLESLHFYQDSLTYYMRSLELLHREGKIDKEKSSRDSATIHSNIGSNYEESDQYDEAMKEYLFGLQERCELRKNGREDDNLKCQIGYSLFNIGSLLLQEKKFKESQDYFVKALPLILCGSWTKEAQGEVHLKWGKALRCESKFDEALYHIKKAKSLLKGRLIASCCIEEGMLWYNQNDLANAEKCFEEGLSILNTGQYFGRDSLSLKLKLGNCYFWNSKVKEARSIHQELLKDLYFNSDYMKNLSSFVSHCHYCLMWDMLFTRNISGCIDHARNWIYISFWGQPIQAAKSLKELEQQYGSLLLPESK